MSVHDPHGVLAALGRERRRSADLERDLELAYAFVAYLLGRLGGTVRVPMTDLETLERPVRIETYDDRDERVYTVKEQP